VVGAKGGEGELVSPEVGVSPLYVRLEDAHVIGMRAITNTTAIPTLTIGDSLNAVT
jgi:hypothetical protein